MCSECHQIPCHPRCPNAPEPAVITNCIHCGTEIHVGEDYYDIDGEPWCYECIESARTNGEQEEYDLC